ncbi:MAG: PAS domain-containing protein [Candidatus Eremiobacteraeota bacterium]|nr:PAS domain-containing protein [Candidatus Eremiobacteraeota bacterium]
MTPNPTHASSVTVVTVTPDALESLAVMLATLPGGFAGAIVAVLADGAASQPDELAIARWTTLQVVTAGDTPVPLRRGSVVVVTARSPWTVEGDTIVPLRDRDEPGGLRGAAAALASRLIAVVLAGARVPEETLDAVRDAGGMVLFEEPTEDGPSLPIAETDLVAERADLAGVLQELQGYVDEPELGQHRLLQRLLIEIRSGSGIDFRLYKTPTILRRLARLMAAGGFSDLGHYLTHLRAHPEEYSRLIRSLLINVTEFFRDPELYEYLRDEIIPDLLSHAADHGNELRLWSAGCATGEEAYSLAILVSEALGERLNDFHVRIFATDLDDDAIAFARRGVYPETALSEMPPELVARYFTKLDEGFEVKKNIRNLTVFGIHDLAQRSPFPRIDLCLCRNVLIYFTKELQQRTLQLFAFSLREDGYLVLGKAETTSPLPEYFKPLHRIFKVYRRHGARVLIPPSRFREVGSSERERIAAPRADHPGGRSANSAMNAILAATNRGSTPMTPRAGGTRPTAAEKLAAVLLESSIGLVLVDRRYDIEAINAAARGFLNVHGIGIGEDLIHAISGISAAEVRASVDAALSGEQDVPQERELELVDPLTDDARFVAITCVPQRDDDGAIDAVAIMIVEITAQVRARREAEQTIAQFRSEVRELAEKADRLVHRHRALVIANDELTNANFDLRNNNEHLLIAAEEAASAGEEIETLNEEMQATNEELETLNEELQATVEELNATNDELEARSVEFQDLATAREQQWMTAQRERDRVLAALNAVDDRPLAILDVTGRLVYANVRYNALFGNAVPELHADGAQSPPSDPVAQALAGRTVDDRFRARLDGREMHVRVRARSFAGNDGAGGVMFWVEPGG